MLGIDKTIWIALIAAIVGGLAKELLSFAWAKLFPSRAPAQTVTAEIKQTIHSAEVTAKDQALEEISAALEKANKEWRGRPTVESRSSNTKLWAAALSGSAFVMGWGVLVVSWSQYGFSINVIAPTVFCLLVIVGIPAVMSAGFKQHSEEMSWFIAQETAADEIRAVMTKFKLWPSTED